MPLSEATKALLKQWETAYNNAEDLWEGDVKKKSYYHPFGAWCKDPAHELYRVKITEEDRQCLLCEWVWPIRRETEPPREKRKKADWPFVNWGDKKEDQGVLDVQVQEHGDLNHA